MQLRRNAARSACFFVGLALASHLCAAGEVRIAPKPSSTNARAWKEDGDKNGVIIYSRTHEGSTLKEFKSVGLIDSPPRAVFAVLNDAAAYPTFMPYCVAVRILRETRTTVTAYHRLDLPLIDDRDYILRSRRSQSPGPKGPIFHIRWKPVTDIGPGPVPGVQRVTVCEGSWLLEPTGTGATRATYTIYSDSGGAIPAFLANSGSRTAIRKVFAAIRTEAHAPKYARAKG